MKRFIKKTLSIVLTLSMIFSLAAICDFSSARRPFSVPANAAEDDGVEELPETGQCGENVYWTYDNKNHKITISGSGKMDDYRGSEGSDFGGDSERFAPWHSFKGVVKEVVVLDGVQSIGEFAFSCFESLETVHLPQSIKTIGRNAFENCAELVNINLPEGLTELAMFVFFECTSLKTIEIPKTINTIDRNLFDGCVNLENVVMHDEIKTIGKMAFNDCNNLESITIPNSVTSIGSGAFSGCTGLTSVTIPDSVTSIYKYAFSDCTSLTDINVSNKNDSYSSQDGVLFDKDKTVLVRYPSGNSRKTYNIPDSVTFICYAAFSGCTRLTSITIPDSVTSIGYNVFSGCTSLTGITIPDGVTEIDFQTFSGCTSLTSITIPDGVTEIDYQTFISCTSLESITIPESVVNISYYAFKDCTALKDVFYGGTEEQWKEITFDEGNDCLLNAEIHYNYGVEYGKCGNNIDYAYNTVYGTLVLTGSGAMKSYNKFIDYPWSQYKNNISYIEVKYGITSIGANAFSGCSGIKEVFLGKNVTRVGTDAFADCSSLTAVSVAAESGFNAINAFSGNSPRLMFVVEDNNILAKSYARSIDANVVAVDNSNEKILDFKGNTMVYDDVSYRYIRRFATAYSSAEFLHFERLEFDGAYNYDTVIISDDNFGSEILNGNYVLTNLYASVKVVKNGESRQITFAEMFDLLEKGEYDAFRLTLDSNEIHEEILIFEKVKTFLEKFTTQAIRAITKAINFIVRIFK